MAFTDKHPSRSKQNGQPASVALFLQGGGALGAYQAGAFEAMAEAGIQPDWVSGVSIGAINGAVIAGNEPVNRVAMLQKLWLEKLSTGHRGPKHIQTHGVENYFEPAENIAFHVAMDSSPVPSPIHPMFHPPKAKSYYDVKPMYHTLGEVVDFDYLNSHTNPTRLSVGTAEVKTRKQIYFDTKENLPEHEAMKRKKEGVMRSRVEIRKRDITADEIIASMALIPYFLAKEIDGVKLCDAGIVSNTPVRFANDTGQLKKGMVVIRPDLFNPIGEDDFHDYNQATMRELEMRLASPFIDLTGRGMAGHIHTILQHRPDESHSKFFDFSKHAIEQNWAAGYENMKAAIQEYRAKSAKSKTAETIVAGNGGDEEFLREIYNGNGKHR